MLTVISYPKPEKITGFNPMPKSVEVECLNTVHMYVYGISVYGWMFYVGSGRRQRMYSHRDITTACSNSSMSVCVHRLLHHGHPIIESVLYVEEGLERSVHRERDLIKEYGAQLLNITHNPGRNHINILESIVDYADKHKDAPGIRLTATQIIEDEKDRQLRARWRPEIVDEIYARRDKRIEDRKHRR